MALRIHVDRTLCDSQAVCTSLAPDVFTIDDDDVMQVVDEYPGEAARPAVEAAVRSCPKGAISLLEE